MNQSVSQPKESWKDKLKDTANYLTVGFCVILYVAMGIMRFEDGSLVLNDFSSYTWLDWVIWSIMTFVPALLAVIVSTTFKREGIKEAEKEMSVIITEYQNLLYVDTTKKVRGKREYLSKGALTDGSKKFVQAAVLSFVTGQLIVNLNTDSVLKIIINISMWAYFGFSAFGKSNEYGRIELKEWYLIEIAKLKKERDEKAEVEKKRIEAAKEEVKKQAEIAKVTAETEGKKKDELILKLQEEIKELKYKIVVFDEVLHPDPKNPPPDINKKPGGMI